MLEALLDIVPDDGQVDLFPAEGAPELLAIKVDPDPMVEGYALTQAHFLECLATSRRLATDGEDTLRTMQIVFAAYASAEAQQPIGLLPLRPEKEEQH